MIFLWISSSPACTSSSPDLNLCMPIQKHSCIATWILVALHVFLDFLWTNAWLTWTCASTNLNLCVDFSTPKSGFYLQTKNFSFSSKCHVLLCMFMQIFNLKFYTLEHTLANSICSFNTLLLSKVWRHWTNPFCSNTDVALSHFLRDKPCWYDIWVTCYMYVVDLVWGKNHKFVKLHSSKVSFWK
jgi:hypothetical protein